MQEIELRFELEWQQIGNSRQTSVAYSARLSSPMPHPSQTTIQFAYVAAVTMA